MQFNMLTFACASGHTKKVENQSSLEHVQTSNDANAAKEIVDLGRAMFNLKEPKWDEKEEKVVGLTTLGVMRIVLDYINWVSELKKNGEDTVTSADVMDSGVDQPTKNL